MRPIGGEVNCGSHEISDESETIGILLIEGYPIIPFSCVVDSLRGANRLSGKELYRTVGYGGGTAKEYIAKLEKGVAK